MLCNVNLGLVVLANFKQILKLGLKLRNYNLNVKWFLSLNVQIDINYLQPIKASTFILLIKY